MGLNSKRYNDVSAHVQELFIASGTKAGLTRAEIIDQSTRRVVIELLEVNMHPAAFKKPGMDVSATITVKDASGKHVYSKGYRGEARTMMGLVSRILDHAVENLVENAFADTELMSALRTSN